ncbi:putative reverse transcriptase domain-containing protein [Tanacetum coccineum]
MEIDIKEDKNEPELTYLYEEVDPLNPPPPASESEPDDEIEVENPVKQEDETIPVSVYEDIDSLFCRMVNFSRQLCGRKTTHALVEKKGEAKDRFYAMEKLVEKLENVKEKAECKKLKKELEEARGFVFKERPNEAIDVPIEDEKSPLSEPVDVAIAAERARQENVRNDASGSGPVRGRDTAPAVRECIFARFIKCNHAAFHGVEEVVELQRWFEKTESVFEISECAEGKKVKFVAATLEGPALTWWKTKVATMGLETVNQMPWTEMKQLMTVKFCLIEEIQQRVKVDAYIQGLTNNIKGEVTSSKPADLNEANNQKQGNAPAMVIAPTDGKLPLCERCFTRHVGQCTIKCHKCRKVRHKERYCREKSVATGANAQPIWTCYDCGEQGHTRNRCTKKVKQEEFGEVRGRAYAIKDVEPKGLNVVTGMFLLNNRYAFVLFDSGSDRSFVNTRFSSLLDIIPIKTEDSYEVELADRRVVSTDTVLKGFTLSLVNHIFEIDL